jgi:hypothetical protein
VAFVEEAQAQRTALAAKREELERLRETPPGAEARQRSIDAFNATLDLLTQECEASGERLGRRMRVPWQLQQCAAINADDHQPVVPLEVIDALILNPPPLLLLLLGLDVDVLAASPCVAGCVERVDALSMLMATMCGAANATYVAGRSKTELR